MWIDQGMQFKVHRLQNWSANFVWLKITEINLKYREGKSDGNVPKHR